MPALPRAHPPAPPAPRRLLRAVHHRAVQGHHAVREAGGQGQEHVRGGQGAAGHAARARRRWRSSSTSRRAVPRGELRGVAARARHVDRRDGRGGPQRRRGQRRPRRMAPHPLARRARRPRRLPPTPPRPPGPGPSDDRVHLLDGGARGGEAGGRRGLLRAAPGRGPLDALELERRHGGGDPARPDGVLQPAERPPGAARGLAAHPDPGPRRPRHVLGDHHRLHAGRLPRRRRRRRRPRRARGALHSVPGAVRRRRARRAGGDADGGDVDDRRRGVRRARAGPRRVHPAGGGQAEPLLRRHGRRRQVKRTSLARVSTKYNL